MKKRKQRRQKHMPQRTCVGCRQVLDKRKLIRIVRTTDGIFVDPTGREAGRGAYLHDLRGCWQKGMKGALENALRTTLTVEDCARLQAVFDTLPDTSPEPVGQPETTTGNQDDRNEL